MVDSTLVAKSIQTIGTTVMEMIMKFRLLIPRCVQLLALAVICLTTSRSWAGPVDCGSKPISLAYFDFGFHYFEKDGKASGINKDLVDELVKRTGCQFTEYLMPRARVWADMTSGKLDMTVTGVQTPEREKFAWFAPTDITKNHAVISSKAASTVRNADDFLKQGHFIFGVVRGFKHGEEHDKWLDQMRQAKRVEESASTSVVMEKLKLGRIDGMFGQAVVYRKTMKDLNVEGEVVIQDWYPADKGVIGNLMLAKTRFSEGEAERWRKLVREIRDDGTLGRIFARYVSTDEVKMMSDF